MKKIPIIVVAIIVTLISCLGDIASATDPESCKDVMFVFARGSGQTYHGSDEWTALNSEVERQIGNIGVSYGVHELDYPAIAIDFFTGLGAFISGGDAFAFGRSVQQGSANLRRLYRLLPNGICLF